MWTEATHHEKNFYHEKANSILKTVQDANETDETLDTPVASPSIDSNEKVQTSVSKRGRKLFCLFFRLS